MGEKPSRRDQSRLDKQRRIREAAAALFRSQGFEATTTEQIAAQADVAKGTLFLYAPSKRHLLLLMYEAELGAVVEQALAEPASGAPADSIAAIFGHFIRLYERDLDLARRFIQIQLFEPPLGDGAALAALLGGLIARISAWQAAGIVGRSVDPALAAHTIFALYLVVLTAWLSGRISAEQRDAQLRASIALHWQGLRAPEQQTSHPPA